MSVLLALIHSEWFRTVFGVLIGFVAAQLSGIFAERRDRKKAISLALSDLLAVRYQLFALEESIEQIGKVADIDIPEHEKSQLWLIFTSLLPDWKELHQRYDQSVTTLAGLDPLLSFELRAKDFILPAVNWMHSLMAKDPQAAASLGPIVKTNLLDKIKPILNKSLVSLAWEKNVLCWYRTRRLVNKQSALPTELAQYLEPLKAALEAQRQAATARKRPQQPG